MECKCRNKRPRQHEWQCQNIWIKQNEWRCKHDQKCKNERKCRQQEFQCPNEWQSDEYTQESLKNYLEKTPKEQNDFFTECCEKCGENCMISSFHLYLQQPKSLEESPAIEIICHLVWNNYYRVFGNWKCNNCFKSWPSSYTWIKLQKFMDKVPGKNLEQGDFYMQSCNRCKNSSMNKILEYEPLQEAESDSPHKQHLCKKCLHGETCHRTGNYFG
ncbi:hypothetical protein C1645_812851 [Glomus cerebriforme]|uniref:3CxxC-type domain-containing protein n=1 Tax=Glomus cerebriforme TaxID=658196 RepID=A0A397TK37_9GLOM|nr:hypothetical protein C1645_812851 [Glomus cerebriforme]